LCYVFGLKKKKEIDTLHDYKYYVVFENAHRWNIYLKKNGAVEHPYNIPI